jgi:hypothetical protein
MDRQEAIAILEDDYGMSFRDAQELTDAAFYAISLAAISDSDYQVSVSYSEDYGYEVTDGA